MLFAHVFVCSVCAGISAAHRILMTGTSREDIKHHSFGAALPIHRRLSCGYCSKLKGETNCCYHIVTRQNRPRRHLFRELKTFFLWLPLYFRVGGGSRTSVDPAEMGEGGGGINSLPVWTSNKHSTRCHPRLPNGKHRSGSTNVTFWLGGGINFMLSSECKECTGVWHLHSKPCCPFNPTHSELSTEKKS